MHDIVDSILNTMYVSLRFLATSASLDILFHEFSESGSFILFVNEFPGIRYARVSGCRGIVEGLKDVSS